ncbi:ABC transporter permease [Floccifex sp.]|uniref:ABC transporter permease n=1 Tax=Floccifex sp. TaxID=2815810 RepID=UPI003F0C6D46
MFRILTSILVSLFCGLFFAFIALKWRWIDEIFSKILLIFRSLPNVTIIILLLFWISREMTVFLVSFLLLFPIIYQNVISTLKEIQTKWKDIMIIYHQSYYYQIRWIYFPLLKTSLYSSLISCSSLGFKVGIMAEILGQVQNGIGRQIQYSRVNFEVDKVMAWTLWILVIVFLFDFLFKIILKILFDDSYTLFFRKKSDKLDKR